MNFHPAAVQTLTALRDKISTLFNAHPPRTYPLPDLLLYA